MRVTIGSYKNFDDGERDRKIQVRIDPWDTWNMDQTLSYIILPMLKQLRATKHGAPNVDIEDCPDHLKPTTKEIAAHKNAGEVDMNSLHATSDSDHFFARWDWVLDEMIFSFENIEWGRSGLYAPIEQPGSTEYEARIKNGFALFGKYFQSLWD
jgi:hypothetical protein|tara:strand:- start:5156 stop:5617 length:462 start_codon:yes stop_codon:yes gene_type:complete